MATKTTTRKRRPTREMRQVELVQRARALEQEIRELVKPLPATVAWENKRRGTTRVYEMDTLKHRVSMLWDEHRRDPKHGRTVRRAMQMWKDMESVLWSLAMTSRRTAHLEARRLTRNALDEQDLRQEGYIGLMRAAKRFDPNQKVKFDTYARWWVRAEMTRALEQRNRTIRIPAGAAEQLRLVQRVQGEWDQEGREYNITQLAEALHLEPARVHTLLSTGTTVSLETSVDTGPKQRVLGSILEETIVTDAESSALFKDRLDRVMTVLDSRLNDKEREVLRLRYGLDDNEFRTLKTVGQLMGISRERVRQIEIVAFGKIRKSPFLRERNPNSQVPTAA